MAPVLFRRRAVVGLGWCTIFTVWLLFLPNAPYVLTDVVHMFGDLHASDSRAHMCAVLLTYALFAGAGLASYVVSMQLFRRFLRRVAPRRMVLPALLLVHGLCVVAMYLGRVVRLNSWDVLTAPRTVLVAVLHVPRPHTVALLAMMFVVVGVGAYLIAAVSDKALEQLRRLNA